MKLSVRIAITIALAAVVTFFGFAQNPTESSNPETQKSVLMNHAREHIAGVALSFKQLRLTVGKLIRARTATAKYRDVRVAERDGYRAIGPDVPGIGIHYVRSDVGEQKVDLDHPPVLLYEKNPKVAGRYRLVGVSYLLDAPAGHDGQPTKSPFPEVLAKWHKHRDVCVLPDSSATLMLNQEQCTAQKGKFIKETPWMVHAWIWRDSPAGVFSFVNPMVK